MNILVAGPSWVGDMMMSQSLYRTIKSRQPQANIDVMAPAWCRPLLARMPEVRQALEMPLGHGALAVRERYRIGRQLQAKGYQQAIVLPNSWKSALIPFFAGIKRRTGWRGEMRYGLLNDLRVLEKAAWPLMVQRYVALAWERGLMRNAVDLPAPLLMPRLTVAAAEPTATLQHFCVPAAAKRIGFCPGAEFGPAKRWPHYHYSHLAANLIDEGYQLIILGSAKDQQAGEAIVNGLTVSQREHCYHLAGRTTLDQAVLLLAACQAVVTNDSGLMHVAAALERPLVALYGPSSPDFTPPLAKAVRIMRLMTGYQRVRKGEGEQGYHQSLIDLTPQAVLAQLHDLLSETGQ